MYFQLQWNIFLHFFSSYHIFCHILLSCFSFLFSSLHIWFILPSRDRTERVIKGKKRLRNNGKNMHSLTWSISLVQTVSLKRYKHYCCYTAQSIASSVLFLSDFLSILALFFAGNLQLQLAFDLFFGNFFALLSFYQLNFSQLDM